MRLCRQSLLKVQLLDNLQYSGYADGLGAFWLVISSPSATALAAIILTFVLHEGETGQFIAVFHYIFISFVAGLPDGIAIDAAVDEPEVEESLVVVFRCDDIDVSQRLYRKVTIKNRESLLIRDKNDDIRQ